MEDKMHEVVQLLLARMKSHPEEFTNGASRWGWMINDVMDHGTDEECAALKAGLRPIRLQEVHELVLDELCNGEERRRKKQEEYEYERNMLKALGAKAQSTGTYTTYATQLQAAMTETKQSMLKSLLGKAFK